MKSEKIELIITTFFKAIDKHNWTKAKNTMTQKVLLDYTSFTGGEPVLVEPEKIMETWAAFLPGFDKTHHQLFNFNILISNEIAVVTYNGKAEHYIANEVWIVEGTYKTELQEINNTWYISKLTFNFGFQSGNLDLPTAATKKMKK
jgi:hypothetical protein